MYRSLNFFSHTHFDRWRVVLIPFLHYALPFQTFDAFDSFTFFSLLLYSLAVFFTSWTFSLFSALTHFNHSVTPCFFHCRCLALALVSFGMLFILKVCSLFEFRTRMKCVKIHEKKKMIHQRYRSKRYTH